MTRKGYKTVIDARLANGVKSVFNNRRYLGYVWELKLECGHYVAKKVRYKGKRKTNYRTENRPVEEVLPAPKMVKCSQCDKLTCHFYSLRIIKFMRREKFHL